MDYDKLEKTIYYRRNKMKRIEHIFAVGITYFITACFTIGNSTSGRPFPEEIVLPLGADYNLQISDKECLWHNFQFDVGLNIFAYIDKDAIQTEIFWCSYYNHPDSIEVTPFINSYFNRIDLSVCRSKSDIIRCGDDRWVYRFSSHFNSQIPDTGFHGVTYHNNTFDYSIINNDYLAIWEKSESDFDFVVKLPVKPPALVLGYSPLTRLTEGDIHLIDDYKVSNEDFIKLLSKSRAANGRGGDEEIWFRKSFELVEYFSSSPLFLNDEFTGVTIGLVGFINEIHDSQDSLSAFLKDKMPTIVYDQSMNGTEWFNTYTRWANSTIYKLNRILLGECIYNEDRFKDIELSETTLRRISEKPQGENLVLLNRRLLEEAYPRIPERAYTSDRNRLYRMDCPLIFEKYTETKTDGNSQRIKVIFNQETDDLRKTKYFVSEIVDFSGGGQVTDTTRELMFDILNQDGYNIKKHQSLTYTYSPFTGHPQVRGPDVGVVEILGEVVSRPVQVIVAERREPSSSDTIVIELTDPEVELLLTAALIDEETGALTPMRPVMLADGRRSLYLALPPSRARVPD